MKTALKVLFHAVPFLAICWLAVVAKADWQYQGNVKGVPVYLDRQTGLVWTRTLGKVASSDWGKSAKLV